MGPAGALVAPPRQPHPPTGMPAREIRFRDVTFAYPQSERPVLEGFALTIPAGSSLAIVGQNGAGKTTLAKLLCRLYDPQSGAIEVDGVDLRDLDVEPVAGAGHRGVPGLHPLRAAAARQRRARGRARRRDPRRARAGRCIGTGRSRHAACPAVTKAAPTCRAGNGSASPSPGPSAPCGSVRGCCCSTSPRLSSTCGVRPRSSTAYSPRRARPRRSSSPTASRPSVMPTASASSSTAGSSSSGTTTS